MTSKNGLYFYNMSFWLKKLIYLDCVVDFMFFVGNVIGMIKIKRYFARFLDVACNSSDRFSKFSCKIINLIWRKSEIRFGSSCEQTFFLILIKTY